jgi:hypothetical protein
VLIAAKLLMRAKENFEPQLDEEARRQWSWLSRNLRRSMPPTRANVSKAHSHLPTRMGGARRVSSDPSNTLISHNFSVFYEMAI